MRVWVLVVLVTGACGDDGGDPPGQAGCNPLGGGSCVLPIPCSYYMIEDVSTATGFRVDYPAGALPRNGDEPPVETDPTWYNSRDGFSADAPILTAFEGGVDPGNLPPIDDPGQSLYPGSPTVVLDMDTGERVVHFAEVDMNAPVMRPGRPDLQALIIRPLVRLQPKRRYAVALRTSLRAADGVTPLATPAGFQSILDGGSTSDARLERIRPRYVDIFAALAADGVPTTDLVVAWDFVTGSDEQVRSDLETARDLALDAMGAGAANLGFSVASDQPGGDPSLTLRVVEGTFDVPMLLTRGGGDDAVLNRGADGRPALVPGETYQANFIAHIPACTATTRPVPILVYGHGLMGSADESGGGYLQRIANDMCMIILATDWRGMSSQDIDSVAFALNDFNRIDEVRDKLVQGIVNFIALEQIARGPMAQSPTFTDAASGEALIDPGTAYYYGNSQGGIFGGVFMAFDPFITRGVLGVPGANYSMMVERSVDWPIYYTILYGAYEDPLDDEVLLHLLQTNYDLVDPISYYPYLTGAVEDPIPGTPQKQVLLHVAVGDAQVPNVSAETAARTGGIPLLGPSVYEPWGLPATAGPLSSAITLWDEHKKPDPPLTNTALDDDNETHGSLRKRTKSQEQLRTFFETGEIVQVCTMGGTPWTCDCVTDEVCGPPP